MNVHELTGTQIVTAPSRDYLPTKNRLFLLGGISNCPNWQQEIISDLTDITDLTIFNPRRDDYPLNNPAASKEQITWEYNHLEKSNLIAVWFSRGSINPIVLYELGKWVNSNPDIPAFLGIDRHYTRQEDVLIQTELARPELKAVFSLGELALAVRTHLQC
jgi:hypothetical protein